MWLWAGGLQAREETLQVDGSKATSCGRARGIRGVLSESGPPACPLTVDLTGGPATSLSSRQLPHAPEHPVATLSASERRAINLTWAKPFDGNSPLIRYVLEMSENSKARAAARAGGAQPWGPSAHFPGLRLRANPSL